MIINGLALFLVVAVVSTVAYFFDKHRTKRPDDAQLADWKEFLIKGNLDSPDKKPRVTTSELPALAYDAIEKLWNPKLQREFNERKLRLLNEICARAIQLEEASRRMTAGKPLSAYDDAILIREGLRNGESKSEPTTEDRAENEI